MQYLPARKAARDSSTQKRSMVLFPVQAKFPIILIFPVDRFLNCHSPIVDQNDSPSLLLDKYVGCPMQDGSLRQFNGHSGTLIFCFFLKL